MKLKDSALGNLARMICGDDPFSYFPYRSSSYLTTFFEDINLDFVHDGSTRYWWVREVLVQLNNIGDEHSEYFSEEIVTVIEHLLDPNQFMFEEKTDYHKAIESVSKVLMQQNISIDESGHLKYLSGASVSEIEKGIQVNLSEGKVEMKQGNSLNKIFISHSTKDSDYVLPIIELLEALGIKGDQIFCTSYEGYGIPLGENFLERIKAELNENVLVLFIFSPNFFSSPVSLCEMGATWVRSSSHIPILIPPFDFSEVKGVLPNTQGFKINVPEKLNTFKKQVLTFFSLKELDSTIWERKRKRFLDDVNTLLEAHLGIVNKPIDSANGANKEVTNTKETVVLEYDLNILESLSSVYSCEEVFDFIDKLRNEKSYFVSQLKIFETATRRFNAPDKKMHFQHIEQVKIEFFNNINKLNVFSRFFFEDNKEDVLTFYGGKEGDFAMKTATGYDDYKRMNIGLNKLIERLSSSWEDLYSQVRKCYPSFYWN